jgi:Protein of unknown function (DUF1573)
MKNYIFFTIIVFTFLSAACGGKKGEAVQEIRTVASGNADLVRNPVSAEQPLDTNLLARIVFEESTHNFGEVKEGKIVAYNFKFKNTGKVPLNILRARSSCGCTVPEWPKEPIAPGETGEISAKFNTEGKTEKQKKLIYVTANTYPNEVSVALEGFVKPK